jgi:Holliday junction DNA helicase RuvA
VIALLRGRVVSATLDAVVLDVGGVGYAVRVAPGTRVGPPGSEATLHTSLAVREDALTLYGFADLVARDLFEVLLGVGGVGPKVALAALGTLGAEGLCRAVVAQDLDALTVVPGIGRKGAQRLVLELGEKLGALSEGVFSPNGATTGDPDARSARGEVAQALAALGYAQVEIRRALDGLDPVADRTAEDLLRDALRGIGSPA